MIRQSNSGFRLVLLSAVACSLCSASALAQFGGPAISTPPKAAGAPDSAMTVEYGEMLIQPGDVISISTYGAPELSTSSQTSAGTITSPGSAVLEGVKVGAKGEVILPYLGAVKLAGLTPAEASARLSSQLKDGGLLVDPQVSVRFVESPTRTITVVGEVLKPEPVPAFGNLHLLDVISACGGFTPLASHTITVRRQGQPTPIVVELGADPKDVNLADIPLMAGDTVIVPKVGSAFIVGQVKTPSAIPLSSNGPITVLRAIAMAGGVNYGAGLSKARIIRTTADNQHVEIMLDLKKMMYGKQQDVALVSDDILFIPTNAFKASLAAGGAGVASQALYGAVYAASVVK